MQEIDAFAEENDPHGEYDFGSFEMEGHNLFWRIDLYEDPSVNAVDGSLGITRVLTIMLAEEY